MKPQNKRKQIAEDTLRIIEQGYFITPDQKKVNIKEAQAAAVAGTKVYVPEETDQMIDIGVYPERFKSTEIIVNNSTTLNATRQLIDEGHQNILCLNFASAKNAGGGFLGGAQAQEESIARASGLYPCLLTASEYYQSNRKMKSCIYTDYMIYSPGVPIFKLESGENMDHLKTTAVITAPAVNTGVVASRQPDQVPMIAAIMKRRIEKVLAIALEHGHDTLVLGAWGCGVFRNDPKDMAEYFREVIDTRFNGAFKKIVFAIYSSNERFITPFMNAFS